MKEDKNIKNKWLHLRLSNAEYEQLHKAFSATTERKLSRYSRNILLGKPMIAGYKNMAMAALIPEFSCLLKTLNGIGNNYNQAVHKLHTLDHFPQMKDWVTVYENSTGPMLHDIAAIKEMMTKITEQWLQS